MLATHSAQLTRSVLMARVGSLYKAPASASMSTSATQEEDMSVKIQKGKQRMIDMGYHGPSLWVQQICWGDHDQVRVRRIVVGIC